MGKNKAYNTGINTKVITVPTSNPPIIVTAREPNKSSPSKGIIPRIVVKEAQYLSLAQYLGRNLLQSIIFRKLVLVIYDILHALTLMMSPWRKSD